MASECHQQTIWQLKDARSSVAVKFQQSHEKSFLAEVLQDFMKDTITNDSQGNDCDGM